MGRSRRRAACPTDRLDIHLTPLAGDRRRVNLIAHSERFAPVIERLRELLRAVSVPGPSCDAARTGDSLGCRFLITIEGHAGADVSRRPFSPNRPDPTTSPHETEQRHAISGEISSGFPCGARLAVGGSVCLSWGLLFTGRLGAAEPAPKPAKNPAGHRRLLPRLHDPKRTHQKRTGSPGDTSKSLTFNKAATRPTPRSRSTRTPIGPKAMTWSSTTNVLPA